MSLTSSVSNQLRRLTSSHSWCCGAEGCCGEEEIGVSTVAVEERPSSSVEGRESLEWSSVVVRVGVTVVVISLGSTGLEAEVVIVGWGVCTVGVLSLSSTKSFAGEDLLLTSSDGCSRGFSMKLGSVVAELLSIC